ncbi:aldolase [Paenibacillus soyae]|uniref:Aldolase n=1 Tax=Paenibacillus soyae TaxID=2969249 RepID=A0A9X2MKV6_9BACL|nr:aldolase [Paenibacillus soyae]MCR2802526.1 aldolase [Paenibacillus soyae]
MVDSNYVYRSFGLRIDSEIPLPELPQCLPGRDGESPDLVISKQNLTAVWQSIESSSEYLATRGEAVYVRVADTGIFGMESGRSISVSLFPEANPDKVRLYLLGTCMGIILLQKRILPLHGSAIEIGGKAYAIVGQSGAGKSTLSTYLLDQGYRLLSDDLIAVTLNEQNTPIVTPSYPQQKIWQETIDLLGMSSAGYKPLFERETKFAVPVAERFCHEPLPLAGVFELVKVERDAALIPIDGMERFHVLLQHTFRGSLVQRLGLMEWHFGTLARFANRLPMNRLTRPQGRPCVRELASLLLQSIPDEGESIQ